MPKEATANVVVFNAKPVQSTVVKEVRETDEPGGAKVKSVLEVADKMLESLAEVTDALDIAVNVLEEVDSKETDVLRDDAGSSKSVKSPRSKTRTVKAPVRISKKKVRPNAESSKRVEVEVRPSQETWG